MGISPGLAATWDRLANGLQIIGVDQVSGVVALRV